MIILGIDPGVISTGYGILSIKGREVRIVDYGIIKISKEEQLPSRLADVYKKIDNICLQYRPDVLALEDVFFNRNVRTALTVGHIRGAIILAAVHHGLSVYTYTPLQIKQAVTGFGRADKEQVQKMLKIILKIPDVPQPDHAADALATALCHSYYAHSLLKDNGEYQGEI